MSMDLLVGCFNHPSIFLLTFKPPTSIRSATLDVVSEHPAAGGSSWLSFSRDRRYLYTTAWTSTPAIAAYAIELPSRRLRLLNVKQVAATSGYVCCNDTHVFSCGGSSGEVYTREGDGSLGLLVQGLDFVTGQGENHSTTRGVVAHGDFGGLRHGAHSIDLSPDGRSAYVADIGRNCIWAYHVLHEDRGKMGPVLEMREKKSSPRAGDGPRHTWPHPNGKVLFCLQEHTSMVDLFEIHKDGDGSHRSLQARQSVKIIPDDADCKLFWADEVRLSIGPDQMRPKYLYASTRGLAAGTRGYVAVFELNEDGWLMRSEPLDIWQTPTSGGLANAIEPAPWTESYGRLEYLAMTDSHEGWISILSFDGSTIVEVVRTSLGLTKDGQRVGAATAVWF